MSERIFATLSAVAALAVFPSLLFARPPRLAFSTYLGGESMDQAHAVAVDDQGGVYVTGLTQSPDFPLRNEYQPVLMGGKDAFVSVFSSDGRLIASTYLGGSGRDSAHAIAVARLQSPVGIEVVIAGWTESPDFPTTPNAVQPARGGESDAFVTSLHFDAIEGKFPALFFSSYLGGSERDWAYGLALDESRNFYVTGATASPDFPGRSELLPKPFRVINGPKDAFLAKINASWELEYAGYLGGGGNDEGLGIAVDEDNQPWVVGRTGSDDFWLRRPLQGSLPGPGAAFVSRFAADPFNPPAGESMLLFSTYLGGSGWDGGEAIALRPGRLPGVDVEAVVAGLTESPDFPTGGWYRPIQAGFGGEIDAFVTVVTSSPPHYRIDYSTYLGGSSEDGASGVACDPRGNIYVAGFTLSKDFPLHAPIQTERPGGETAFVSKLSPTGESFVYSTYLGGGSDDDAAYAVAADSTGAAYVVGYSYSDDFPIVAAFQPSKAGGPNFCDAFVARISPPFTEWHLPAGAVNISDVLFDTYILVANPNHQTAPVRVEFFGREGLTAGDEVEMPPLSRRTFKIGDYVLELDPSSDSISTVVTSLNGLKIFCERAMYFPGGSGPGGWIGGNNTIGISEPATEWNLPEGATHQFTQFIHVLNPGPYETEVTVTFMDQDGVTETVDNILAPETNWPIHVNSIAGWADKGQVSTRATSTGGPVAVDRTMYSPKCDWRLGHSSRGISEPSTVWFLAEGANHLFDHYVLVSNPSETDPADVHFTFMDQDGDTAFHQQTVEAQSRYTVKVNSIPGWENRDQVSTEVVSENDVPVFVERAMYWPRGNPEDWTGGHNSIGAPAPAFKWHLPEGATHHFDEYILIANPHGTETAVVDVTLMRADGGHQTHRRNVGPRSRETIHVNSLPGWNDRDQVSAVVESQPAPFVPFRIFVERAMYFPRGGPGTWRDGHATIGIAE